MGRYDPIHIDLVKSYPALRVLPFAVVESILGAPLPQTAYDRVEWWANEDLETTRHVQCRSWQSAGYNAEPDIRAKVVTFRPK